MARYGTHQVNEELATAVRDVVHLNRNGSSQPLPPSQNPYLQASNPAARSGASSGASSRGTPAENPFDEAIGAVDQSLPKNNSSSPGLLTVDEGRPSSRRTLSEDERAAKAAREESRRDRRERRQMVGGQTKEAADKKGSRHADVIDTWDPTGLGSAMWHHSGPYDAAAPSRNVNQPALKAPMHAFNGAPPPPPRTAPTAIQLNIPEKAPEEVERRGSGSARPIGQHRRSGGGLSGQYSTSVPSGGGYFPEDRVEENPDDESAARRRAREEKRKALKAAWGIDTPEPFEDFGSSPRDETINLPDHTDYSRGPRSPAMRMGLGGKSPGTMDESVLPPIPDEKQRPAGGIKRTKSLMQKIKSMRGDGDKRSGSPNKYSPGAEYPPMPPAETLQLGGGRSPARLNNSTSGNNSGYNSHGSNSGSGAFNTPNKELPNPHDGQTEELSNEPVSPAVDSYHSRRPSAPGYLGSNGKRQAGHPPVGPVMPDFEDLVPRRRSTSTAYEPEVAASTMKRKTSVVKKLKDRVVKT